jgi:hypothetical protein
VSTSETTLNLTTLNLTVTCNNSTSGSVWWFRSCILQTFKTMHWKLLLLLGGWGGRFVGFPLGSYDFLKGWGKAAEIMRVFLPSAAANWREIKLLQTTVCEIVPNKSLKLGGEREREREGKHVSLRTRLSCSLLLFRRNRFAPSAVRSWYLSRLLMANNR